MSNNNLEDEYFRDVSVEITAEDLRRAGTWKKQMKFGIVEDA